MSGSRTKNTKRNIIFSCLEMFLVYLFQFVSRTVIVRTLGADYLGLSSLFQSILHVLSMAELGFSDAIVYNMYRPIAENDTEKVCALLNFYRKVYRTVGLVILVVGLAVTPFLPRLIKGTPPESVSLYALYFLYLANTCVSYVFFAYKASLLNALQRLDLLKIAYMVVNLAQYAAQILSLILFRNYYLFVFFVLAGSVCKNLMAEYVSVRKFPQYVCRGRVTPQTMREITARVKGLLVGRISSVTYTTFDSIILSSMIGLTSVSIYGNYTTISNGVTTFITLIRTAMQASVGNSVALESREKNYRDMLLWQFLFSFIAAWCVTCMSSLYQPFMELWMGRELLRPYRDVVLICLWYYVTGIRHAYYLYLSANGLWWEMRWPYILSTVSNLVLNIILGRWFGMTGVLFATVIATSVFGLFWQCGIIFRLYFHRSRAQYYRRQVLYAAVCLASSAAAYFLNALLRVGGIPGLLARGVVCTVVSVGLQILLYRKTDVFRQAEQLCRQVIRLRTT